jgi:hypothetical protein
MRKFKTSVSDWLLTFENKEEVAIETITKEIVTMFSSGKSNILLVDACFDSHFIDLFKENAVLSNIKQTFELRNSLGEKSDTIEYEYVNMKISKIKILSNVDGVADVAIFLKSK